MLVVASGGRGGLNFRGSQQDADGSACAGAWMLGVGWNAVDPRTGVQGCAGVQGGGAG